MTKKLEDFFNLPDKHEDEIELDFQEETIEENPVVEYQDSAEKLENSLPAVKNLEQHDREMDEIAKKAITSFEDLMTLGKNVPDKDAGRIFETAAAMLDVALRAKESKSQRKIKTLELQMRKLKLDQTTGKSQQAAGSVSQGRVLERNELLKMFRNIESQDTPHEDLDS